MNVEDIRDMICIQNLDLSGMWNKCIMTCEQSPAFLVYETDLYHFQKKNGNTVSVYNVVGEMFQAVSGFHAPIMQTLRTNVNSRGL